MTAEINAKYWLRVRRKFAFLSEIMSLLQGTARISLEGDLSSCRSGADLQPSPLETGSLKRATLQPELDFIILSLDEKTISGILKEVLRAGLRRVIHVQIEKQGALQVGAYDNFHPDCVVVGELVPAGFLGDLVKREILWGFTPGSSDTEAPDH